MSWAGMGIDMDKFKTPRQIESLMEWKVEIHGMVLNLWCEECDL
jgi:hypothetical protein